MAFIDLYKRGSFVLVAKQIGETLDNSGWDKAVLKTHKQADQNARAGSNAPPNSLYGLYLLL